MAFVTYPLDDIDFSAEDAELFNCPRNSGIYAKEDFAYSVTGTDNVVTVGAGIGWIRNSRFKGKVIAMKEEVQIDMGLPDASYPRYDVIAIRFSVNGNNTELIVKKGTPASAPVLPAITQTEAEYELYLYQVRREVGATAVTVKDVTDLRLNASYCGLMADAITKIDTAAINAQIMALVESLQEEITAVKDGTAYVMKSGDSIPGDMTMEGAVTMKGTVTVTGTTTVSGAVTMKSAVTVPTPGSTGHAANKGYVDTKFITGTLTAANWAGSAPPYTQAISVSGLTDAKSAIAYPVYPGSQTADLALKEACACVSYARRSGTYVTFVCLEEKPAVNIPVRVEVRV